MIVDEAQLSVADMTLGQRKLAWPIKDAERLGMAGNGMKLA